MKYNTIMATNSDCYKAGKYITPKGVMVHSTGANNPYLKRYVAPDDGLIGKNVHGNDWNRPGVGAMVHAFIGKLNDGKVATYQVLPWNMRGWHCAKSGNNTHISFEICEDGLTDREYFLDVYQQAVELTAMLCDLYDLNPMEDGVVICHSEGYTRGIASNHADVMHWFPKFGYNMDIFREDVADELATIRGEGSTFEREYQAAKDFVTDIGLFKGSNIGMEWDRPITRGEMALVLYRLCTTNTMSEYYRRLVKGGPGV